MLESRSSGSNRQHNACVFESGVVADGSNLVHRSEGFSTIKSGRSDLRSPWRLRLVE